MSTATAEDRKRPAAPSVSLSSATSSAPGIMLRERDPQSHRTPKSKRARIPSAFLVAAAAAPPPPDFTKKNTAGASASSLDRTTTNSKRSVTFAPQLETVHPVPSIKDLLSSEEMQKLWLRSECILSTIDEAVLEAAEQDEDHHRAAQEQYLQILTETYCRCCEQGEDDDSTDDDSTDSCSKASSKAFSSSTVSPLLASYRGLEFAVVPELLKLRSCQRATSIQNLCALARQLQHQASAAAATTTSSSSLADVASRSSRTARRFARAMGVADALAVAAQDQTEAKDDESVALAAADGGCITTAASILFEASSEKVAAPA